MYYDTEITLISNVFGHMIICVNVQAWEVRMLRMENAIVNLTAIVSSMVSMVQIFMGGYEPKPSNYEFKHNHVDVGQVDEQKNDIDLNENVNANCLNEVDVDYRIWTPIATICTPPPKPFQEARRRLVNVGNVGYKQNNVDDMQEASYSCTQTSFPTMQL